MVVEEDPENALKEQFELEEENGAMLKERRTLSTDPLSGLVPIGHGPNMMQRQ